MREDNFDKLWIFFLQKPAAVSAAFDMAFHAFGMIVCLRVVRLASRVMSRCLN